MVKHSQLDFVQARTKSYIQGPHRFQIGGKSITPMATAEFHISDPSTGELLSEFASATEAETDAAISAARHSFDTGIWRNESPAQRAQVLWRVAELIEENRQLLGELEAVEGGKLIGAALHGEVWAAAEAFRYHAGWCTKIEGKTFKPSIPGLDLEGTTRLEPIGVAGLITPWNGSLVMSAWKLAPALAAGCSVVLKPSENTVLSALRLGELLGEAGIPAGVVNIVLGDGRSVGAQICEDKRVDKVSFTGSTSTGRALIDAARGNLKKLSLELGGKSPVLIFDDADIGAAIDGAAEGIFSNAGQVCVAGSRILVHASKFDEVVAGIAGRADALAIGPTMDENNSLGPLISEPHRNSVSNYVERARTQGVEVVTGGKLGDGDGYFYQPTVLIDHDRTSCAWSDEIFGPVATVTRFETEAEALALANDTQYGLAASVWSENTSRVQRATRDLRAGIVWVNCHGIPDMSMPIGGYKQSGWGREHGWNGVEAFLEHKSIMQRVMPDPSLES
ncbi:MAG: aldehyde dehydrogenase family protein [Henriciella sp.]